MLPRFRSLLSRAHRASIHPSRASKRSQSTLQSSDEDFKVAIVGSGPAGFYVAQHLIRHSPKPLQVDIYERLPVPFGLVRYGVAPDHPDVKNVDSTFSKVAKHPKVRFVGNVAVGSDDLRVSELRKCYNAVVLAYGAAKDRQLDIPGESLANVLPARTFVGLYNGLPEAVSAAGSVRLDTHDTAVVVGVGNVALDVARMLLTPLDVLAKTDMTEQALELLKTSTINRVHVVGRRGPLQVSFTIKELREMVNLQGCTPVFDREVFEPIKQLIPSLERPRKRLTELMVKTSLDPPSAKQKDLWSQGTKKWHLDLFRTPQEILPSASDPSSVGALRLGISTPTEDQSGLIDTGRSETIECGLVLKSIGYKSVQVEESVPYDPKGGVVPNEGGRVVDHPWLYCAGWLATGPRGVIVDTMTAAYSVAQNIVEDIATASDSVGMEEGYSAVGRLFAQRGVRPVTFEDWERIDAEEKSKGQIEGKPRAKFTDVNQMVDVLKK